MTFDKSFDFPYSLYNTATVKQVYHGNLFQFNKKHLTIPQPRQQHKNKVLTLCSASFTLVVICISNTFMSNRDGYPRLVIFICYLSMLSLSIAATVVPLGHRKSCNANLQC